MGLLRLQPQSLLLVVRWVFCDDIVRRKDYAQHGHVISTLQKVVKGLPHEQDREKIWHVQSVCVRVLDISEKGDGVADSCPHVKMLVERGLEEGRVGNVCLGRWDTEVGGRYVCGCEGIGCGPPFRSTTNNFDSISVRKVV